MQEWLVELNVVLLKREGVRVLEKASMLGIKDLEIIRVREKLYVQIRRIRKSIGYLQASILLSI
jgi:hypothetical protein